MIGRINSGFRLLMHDLVVMIKRDHNNFVIMIRRSTWSYKKRLGAVEIHHCARMNCQHICRAIIVSFVTMSISVVEQHKVEVSIENLGALLRHAE